MNIVAVRLYFLYVHVVRVPILYGTNRNNQNIVLSTNFAEMHGMQKHIHPIAI